MYVKTLLSFFWFKTQFLNYIIQDGTDQESRYVNVLLHCPISHARHLKKMSSVFEWRTHRFFLSLVKVKTTALEY